MKIKYNGKEHETEIDGNGHVVSKVGNIFFGFSEKEIIRGTVIEEVVKK